nr:hypothetical protein [Pseudomonadota bacterium]
NPFDGFAYFGGDDDRENRRRYVGILSNTNMGAPLTPTVGRSIWKAFIASGEGIISGEDDFTTPTAFNLMVNFNATGGTINAFIPTSNPRFAFRIVGEFDAGGVITGITDRRTYSDNTDVSTFDASSSRVNTVGTLRGLIGSDGAVGVFTTDAEDAGVPYAGGFVAQFAPLLPGADHALYAGVFSPLPSVANLQGQAVTAFAQPTAEGFSTTELRFQKRPSALNDDCRNCFPNLIIRLGGNNTDTADTDGFAMIYGRLNAGSSVRVRAGLLPVTDLGALLGNTAPDGAATANWPGTIYHSRHLSGTNPNQVLTPFTVAFAVDFAAGTFELPNTVLANRGLSNQQTIRVAGRFGSHVEAVDGAATPARLPVGVLGGTVYYQNGPSNGAFGHALQGLIGAEGAVGVFAVSSTSAEVGGFVARNAPVPVNHAGYIAQHSDLQTEGNGTADFVRGLENGLDVSNVNFINTGSSCAGIGGCIENYLVRLGGNNADTDDPSGFALFLGNGHATNPSTNRIYRVGLLSGTDVGAGLPPLAPDGTATALWSGKVHTTLDSTGGTITPHDLTLTVNYTTRKIATTTNNLGVIPGGSGGNLSVDGGYGITGVMSGRVTFDSTSGTADRNFNLRGLIGTEGAIGIFEANGASHVGGFIVKPSAQ